MFKWNGVTIRKFNNYSTFIKVKTQIRAAL